MNPVPSASFGAAMTFDSVVRLIWMGERATLFFRAASWASRASRSAWRRLTSASRLTIWVRSVALVIRARTRSTLSRMVSSRDWVSTICLPTSSLELSERITVPSLPSSAMTVSSLVAGTERVISP